MSHPLEGIIRGAGGFVVFGDSSHGTSPGTRVKPSGTYCKPAQTDATARRRDLW